MRCCSLHSSSPQWSSCLRDSAVRCSERCDRGRAPARGRGDPMMSTLLEVQDVRHSFRGLQVLKGVSCDVGEGELVGLIGPNGAGKSTLVNVISGFLVPDAGTLRYAGEY